MHVINSSDAGSCNFLVSQRIPKAFNKFLNGYTTNEVTLVDHDDNSWDIDLAKIEDRFIFKSGWQRFAKEKGLESGDFLVFEHDGNSTFYVKMFSKCGCRKEAENCGNVENCGKVVPKLILDEDSNQRGCKRKHSSIGLKINEKSNLEGPSKRAKSKSTRAHEANCDNSENKAPHFMVHFSATKLQRLEIPGSVMKKWGIKLESTLRLRNVDGNQWLVNISTSCTGRYYLGHGFPEFIKSNNIRKGYQRNFEFVIGKGNVAREILVGVEPK
ncbi:hypothetical protein RIF29_24291 [Crotalaria pallida]|uniref:TF-B3 domain-containing protein n=1 Tax=Crotalaria pallida TaxID=3830 RepID=A0AAN9EKB5_CROPI